MADEITITAKLLASKLGSVVSNTGAAINADMAGDQMYHATPSISTTVNGLRIGAMLLRDMRHAPNASVAP